MYAQEETIYRTKQLEEIGQMLETCGISAMKPGIYDADAICLGKKVRVEAGFGGLISSIGLELFDTRVVAEYLRPVYDFVERYLLRLLLIDKPDEILRLLNDDKVELVLNGVPFEKKSRGVGFVRGGDPAGDGFRVRCRYDCLQGGLGHRNGHFADDLPETVRVNRGKG